MTRFQAVFRNYQHPKPYWEGYGLHTAAYAAGDTLAEACLDMRKALAVLVGCDPDGVALEVFQEFQVLGHTDSSPEVWVRVPNVPSGEVESAEIDNILARRAVMDAIKERLAVDPELATKTFSLGEASTGDVIVVVAMEDDPFSAIVGQVGDIDRIYICMPDASGLQWRSLSSREAVGFRPEFATPVSELDIPAHATVKSFMEATQSSANAARDIALASA